MTEKDAARCRKIINKNIWVLKIEAELPQKFSLKVASLIKEKTQ